RQDVFDAGSSFLRTRSNRDPVADSGIVITAFRHIVNLAGHLGQVFLMCAPDPVQTLEFLDNARGHERPVVKFRKVAFEKRIPAQVFQVHDSAPVPANVVRPRKNVSQRSARAIDWRSTSRAGDLVGFMPSAMRMRPSQAGWRAEVGLIALKLEKS